MALPMASFHDALALHLVEPALVDLLLPVEQLDPRGQVRRADLDITLRCGPEVFGGLGHGHCEVGVDFDLNDVLVLAEHVGETCHVDVGQLVARLGLRQPVLVVEEEMAERVADASVPLFIVLGNDHYLGGAAHRTVFLGRARRFAASHCQTGQCKQQCHVFQCLFHGYNGFCLHSG